MKRLSAFCCEPGIIFDGKSDDGSGSRTGRRCIGILCAALDVYSICGTASLYCDSPLVKAEWWEEHQPHAVALWSIFFIIPFAMRYSAGTALETVLECLVNDYLTFIILLFGLFCVAGNITMSGDLAGSPACQCGITGTGNPAFKLDRYDRCQYADDSSGCQDECMEKEETSYHYLLYFPCIQHRRMSDPDR